MLFDELIHVQDPEPHGAALNMAIDEVLLREAKAPTLRIYRWARPSVSFGYFGGLSQVAAQWPRREWVRRWTGGGVVLHGEDLTYTLVVPRSHPFAALGASESYQRVHHCLARVLGGGAHMAESADPKRSEACFENAVPFDVLAGGQKVAGAAQRRTRLGLLHQGSVQIGSDEVAGLEARLPGALGRHVHSRSLAVAELGSAAELAARKYASDSWLRRV